MWTPRWGGNDGPDDGAENMLNWTLLHALGGSSCSLPPLVSREFFFSFFAAFWTADGKVLEMFRVGWEGKSTNNLPLLVM